MSDQAMLRAGSSVVRRGCEGEALLVEDEFSCDLATSGAWLKFSARAGPA